MEREHIQISYISDDIFIFITNTRDVVIEFKCKSKIRIINPSIKQFLWVLNYSSCSLHESLRSIFGDILRMEPDCGVFSKERTKFRFFLSSVNSDFPSKRLYEINDLIDKLWSNYAGMNDLELLKILSRSLYKIANVIPLSYF